MKLAAVLAGAALVLVAPLAQAQEVTLRAVSAFAEKTQFSRHFERFIEKVNEDGKGVLKINYIGGPRAVPPFEVGNAVKNGVVDMANVTGAFYTNLMPEADALKLATKSVAEMRGNGAHELIDKLHQEKLNAVYLARQYTSFPFHIYLAKRIAAYDFTGMKIRVTPVYKEMVEALGGVAITTPPGEVYTAMERGVVDGYGWPISGIFDLGWHEVTKFRVDPGFYRVDVNVLVNRNVWQKLGAPQKKLLQDAALWLEGLDAELEKVIADERARQAQAKIETIAFDEAAQQKYLATATEAAWKSVIAKSPETGPKLRQLIAQ